MVLAGWPVFGHPAPGLRAQASSPRGRPEGACRPRAQPGLLRTQGSGPEDAQGWLRSHLHPPPPVPACCPLLGVQPGHSPGASRFRATLGAGHLHPPPLAPRPAACLLPDKGAIPVTMAVTGWPWPGHVAWSRWSPRREATERERPGHCDGPKGRGGCRWHGQ